MKSESYIERICPRCRNAYRGYPALSRKDNKTHICPECGTREALEAMGLPKEEINSIIGTINKSISDRNTQ